jgi:hypothetical protein
MCFNDGLDFSATQASMFLLAEVALSSLRPWRFGPGIKASSS